MGRNGRQKRISIINIIPFSWQSHDSRALLLFLFCLFLAPILILFSLIFLVLKMHPGALHLATLLYLFFPEVSHFEMRSYSSQILTLCMVYERARGNCQILKIKIHLLCIVTNSWHLFSQVEAPHPSHCTYVCMHVIYLNEA